MSMALRNVSGRPWWMRVTFSCARRSPQYAQYLPKFATTEARTSDVGSGIVAMLSVWLPPAVWLCEVQTAGGVAARLHHPAGHDERGVGAGATS